MIHELTLLAVLAAAALTGWLVHRSSRRRSEESSSALRRHAERLEQRLGASEAQRDLLETVIFAMGEGVLVVGSAGRVLLANPRLRELFAAPAALEGHSLLEAVRHAEIVDAIEAALSQGAVQQREVTIGPAQERLLRFSVAPFPSRDARAGAVAVFRDVTEVRRIETIRRDFVANASHELKTPLAVIRGFAERLADAPLPDATAKHAVEAIVGNAKRLGALVGDLLELSRIESGSMALRPESIAAGEVASRLLRELAPQLRSGELEHEVRVEGAGRVLADRGALEQVLANLLDNAIKYTPAGGSVLVHVRPAPGDRQRIEVSDSGIGIPSKDLPRIFERFYRVDPSRSRALGGTGLGLAIVNHLVEAMGGQIGVESHFGHGSRFWIELPGAQGELARDV